MLQVRYRSDLASPHNGATWLTGGVLLGARWAHLKASQRHTSEVFWARSANGRYRCSNGFIFELEWNTSSVNVLCVSQSFTLEFHFEPNGYFNNAVLTKVYKMKSEPDASEPFSFEGPEIIDCEGWVWSCKLKLSTQTFTFNPPSLSPPQLSDRLAQGQRRNGENH